eukprot:4505252-Pyramimonas_sp.AAC.1
MPDARALARGARRQSLKVSAPYRAWRSSAILAMSTYGGQSGIASVWICQGTESADRLRCASTRARALASNPKRCLTRTRLAVPFDAKRRTLAATCPRT